MNVGQILETHLGWASAGLGRQIGELVDRYTFAQRKNAGRGGPSLDDPRDKLKTIYSPPIYQTEIADHRDDELLELARNLKVGACPSRPRCSTVRARKTSAACSRWPGSTARVR